MARVGSLLPVPCSDDIYSGGLVVVVVLLPTISEVHELYIAFDVRT